MGSYRIVFSAEFDRRIAEIERDVLGFGEAQTGRYIDEIISRCERLGKLPRRFSVVTINGIALHSFTHKAHRIFYRVVEADKTVEIVTVLHGAMRPDLHIGSDR